MISSDQSPVKFYTKGEAFNETSRFLNFVFGGFQSGLIELGYSSHQKATIEPCIVYLSLPLIQNLPELLDEGKQQSIFFGPATRLWRKNNFPKMSPDANINEIGCVWAELDYDKTPGGTLGVIEQISNLQLRPSLIVNSGVGCQIYYVLKTPLKGRKLLDWKEMNINLRNCLGVPSSAIRAAEETSPSRRLPLPGTFNLKFDTRFECLISEDESSWLRYPIEEVKRFLADQLQNNRRVAPTGTIVAPPILESEDSDGEFFSFSPTSADLRGRNVPLKVVEAIFSGKTMQGGRYEQKYPDSQFNRDFWITKTLIERNFTCGEIKAIFRNNPAGCGSKWARSKTGEKYLEKVITKTSLEISSEAGFKSDGNSTFTVHSIPPGYELKENGSVWVLIPSAHEGKEPKTAFVSRSPIRIGEIRENIDSGQISVVISYEYLGKNRSTIISRAQMCNAKSLVSLLSGEGAPVNSNNARQVVGFLADYEHAFAEFIPHKQVTSRFGRGRSSRKFFLPGLSSHIEFAPAGAGDNSIYKAYSARNGNLHGWVEMMNGLEQGSYIIPQIAVVAAFVPPLQKILQIPNFIVDIYGNTSSGKSTTLKLAASVYGRPFDPDSLINQWTNTKLAVEQLAGMCSELPIFLDDAQHCTADLKRSVIYMIANGKGKGRGSGKGGIQETMTWRTVALSTSEEPLYQSSPHEGVRGRLLPVGGLNPPFPPNSSVLVQHLEKAINDNHGFAGEAFIRHLNGWNDKDWMKWQKRYDMLRSELTHNSSSDIVGRVGGYISAIGVTGEIICPLLGLKFKPDVLVAWLLTHIQEQQSNQNLVLTALRALAEYYLSNSGYFSGTDKYKASRNLLQGISKRGEYVGFMRSALDAVFIKHKWSQTMILNKMAEAGVLHSTETDRHTKKVTIEGVKHRLVCVKWSAILPDDNPASY